MRHILHLHAAASLPAIQATIAQTRAKRIALVFPLGVPAQLSTHHLLEALNSYCLSTSTDVAIIGGDATLRAAAVAAGFVVATTLEEWETSAHRAVRPPTRGNAPLDPTHLTLVHDDDERDDALASDTDAWDDELPDYVVELLGTEGASASPPTSGPLPLDYVSWDAGTGADEDEDDEEAVLAAAESYEETITSTIRNTGQLPELPTDMPRPPAPSSAADANRSDGDSESY